MISSYEHSMTNLQLPQIIFLSPHQRPHCTQNCKKLYIMHSDNVVFKELKLLRKRWVCNQNCKESLTEEILLNADIQ